jgi:DNA-binding Xre family transcriptional regulator
MTPVRLRLRALRQERGLSQLTLSENARVAQSTISNLESGKAQRVDLNTLDRLSKALRVQPGELLERSRR